ncbi:MAG: PIN domain-containing protein [Nitrosopumilaceae archaeon]
MSNHLIGQSSEQIVVLDSCVVIALLRRPRIAYSLMSLFRGKHLRIGLQDIVLSEVHKITGFSTDKIVRKISEALYKMVFVFSTTDAMQEVAKTIEQKYEICHFPDSLILAACQVKSWTLLTVDLNMLRSAEFEGILAFNPAKATNF